MRYQSVLSTQYVVVVVNALKDGVAYNPTGDPVAIAILPSNPATAPGSGDWKGATWETTPTAYNVLLLVGPSGGVLDLVQGVYDVWIRITDDPEIPVQLVYQLEMTP
ncbi:MAG: hypothetical protein ACRDYC_05550 [Acidimicrobiales bacterium]